jgi:surface protein
MNKRLLKISILLFVNFFAAAIFAGSAGFQHFIIKVDTGLQGVSANNEFTIRTTGAGYNYNVDCDNDFINEAVGVTGNYTCVYPVAGISTISISDNIGDGTGFPRVHFNNNGDQRKILEIINWGTGKWTSMAGAFRGADHMIVTAGDVPDLSLVTDMSSMFRFASLANPDTTDWDVANVITMHSMFRSAAMANPNTSNWVTTSLQITTDMFWNASPANPDMSGWDISAVTDMSRMLLNANLATTNYDAALSNFGSQTLQTAVTFDAGLTKYCVASAQFGKLEMVVNNAWLIADDGLCTPTFTPDLIEAADTGVSSTDNVTSQTMPSFDVMCLAGNNKIRLYSNNPANNTLLNLHTCTTGSGSGIETITVDSPLPYGSHQITYTQGNPLANDTSEHSNGLSLTIADILPAPATPDLVTSSDTGTSDSDNVTSVLNPQFNVECTAINTTIRLYKGTPSPATVVSIHSCSTVGNAVVDSAGLGSEGVYEIIATQADINGQSAPSAPLILTIDLSLNDFVIQVKTDNGGSSSDTQFTIPTLSSDVYNYNVDCDNDGINEATAQTGDYTCDYPIAGTYTIRIKDNTVFRTGFPRIKLYLSGQNSKIINLLQWGTGKWSSMSQAFSSAAHMVVDATDVPDLSQVTNLNNMFSNATLANPDTSRWDTSNITSMFRVFSSATSANPDVSAWNTSQVTWTGGMFDGAASANPDVSLWDTSVINDMSDMFRNTSIADPDVSQWDTSNVTNTGGIFAYAQQANPDISGWDTSRVTRMSEMFAGQNAFTGDLTQLDTTSVRDMKGMFQNNSTINPQTGIWDTSLVTDMSYMFAGASNATPDISQWNTTLVTNMEHMFNGATNANPDVSLWNTSKVTRMNSMFEAAINADPDTNLWDTLLVTSMEKMFKNATSATLLTNGLETSRVTRFNEMFSGAISANPDMSGWDFGRLLSIEDMFLGVTLATSTYDALLINLANTVDLQVNRQFNGGNSVYCSQAAQQAHADLVNNFNWTFLDGGACAGANPNVAPSFSITCDIDATDVLRYNTGPGNKSVKGVSASAFIAFENFITNMSVGPASESLQTYTLTATVIADPDSVIGNTPSNSPVFVNNNGYLEILINDQSNGVATLAITMQDTGGTANGGVDTTIQQFNLFYFSDLTLDPNLPIDILYKNTFDPCRSL